MKNSRLLHNSRIPFPLASAIAAMLATQAAHAATGTWNVDANGLWSNAGNWTPGIADGSGFIANFTNNITADRTVSLDSARTLGSLVFGDSNTATAGSWILDNNGNAANTLTGLGTITVNALGTGKTATISAVIAGSAPITTSGGTLVLSGANTLNKTDSNNASFAWRLNAGTVVVASNSAFGVSTGTGFNATTLVNLNGAALQASGSARTVANPLWLNASTTTVSGSESLTFSGTASGRGGNATVTNNITGGGTLSFTGNVYTDFQNGFKNLTFGGTGNTLISGVIANNTGNVAGQNGIITKSGTGTLTLSNTASTYTGLTTINAGVMEVAVLANGGTASSIGQSTNAASNLVFAAPTATLRYNGSSNSTTNRGFTLSSGTGGGATIESSGSGTLTIDNTIALAYGTTGQTRLITLGGTNAGANTFSKVIADNGAGATSLTKTGAGQWVLGGTNTYTGLTTINAGVMEVAVLANGGTASSIGQSTNAASNLVFAAPTATLRYNGSSNATTNRGFTLSSGAGGGATIESSGSGTLTIDNTVAMAYGTTGQTRLLTLGGTNTGANTFSKVIADNGAGATSLTKAGAGQWVLGGTNTYTGATTVSAGKLAVNGSTSASSAVGVSSGAALGGSGTVGGNTTIASGGTLAPGNSPGVLTIAGTTTLSSGSMFEWEIDTAQISPETNRGVAYDGLNTSALIGSGAIFKIMLTGDQNFTDAFWSQTRTWTDIFKSANGSTNLSDWASVFSGGFQYSYNGQNVQPTAQGAFTMNGSSLTWSAVPEPSNAIIGLLAATGLLRRRRMD